MFVTCLMLYISKYPSTEVNSHFKCYRCAFIIIKSDRNSWESAKLCVLYKH